MDTIRAEELLMRIGSAILSDPAVRERNWDGLALVAFVDENSVSVSGYLYQGDIAQSFAPEGDALYDLLPAFREATSTGKVRLWKACLIQIVQPDFDFEVVYEYDDPDRWRVTPENVDMLPAALNPLSDT